MIILCPFHAGRLYQTKCTFFLFRLGALLKHVFLFEEGDNQKPIAGNLILVFCEQHTHLHQNF